MNAHYEFSSVPQKNLRGVGHCFGVCRDFDDCVSFRALFHVLVLAMRRYWLRAGLVGIAVLIAWAVYVSSKQLTRNERIESEVEALRSEAEKIRRENETLHEKIGYFSTPDFQEQEAKEKLGMKKEYEEVVVIKERPEEAMTPPLLERQPARLIEEPPHYRQWFELFFTR